MADPTAEELARSRATELDTILQTGPEHQDTPRGKPSRRLEPNKIPHKKAPRAPAEDHRERVSRARPQASRLSSVADREADLGTTFAGGRGRAVHVTAPTIDDHASGTAAISFECSGSPAFTARWIEPITTLEPFHVAPPVSVSFAPRKPGGDRAALVFTYRWSDGHVEQQRTLLTGNAEPGKGMDVPEPLAPKPQAVRLQSHEGKVDLGEQVIGSRDTTRVKLPTMMDLASGKALVMFRTEGSAAISASWPGAVSTGTHLEPMSDAKKLHVTFRPRTKGEHHSKIELSYLWQDGHAEEVTLKVHGSARAIDQIPSDRDEVSAPIKKPQESLTPSPASPFDNLFNTTMDNFVSTVKSLHDAQVDGVGDVEKEAEKYKKPLPERSAWLALAEIALVMGTAGVASAASKLIAPLLAGVGAKLIPKSTKLVRKGEDFVYEAIERSAVAAAATEGLATSIEDGMKHAVDLNRSKLRDASGDNDDSSNKNIAFFSRQRTALRAAGLESAKTARNRGEDIRPMLHVAPQMMVTLLRALDAQLATAHESSKNLQARVTMAKYLAYRARASLGTEEVSSKGGTREVTKLDTARAYDGKFSGPSQAVGLLDIIVNGEAASVEDVRVTGARVIGLSIDNCDRLAKMNLVAEQVPIRIVFSAGMELGWITRDELGRIRTSGRWLSEDTARLNTEAERDPAARRVVAKVLGKTLAQWGVAIATDSAE